MDRAVFVVMKQLERLGCGLALLAACNCSGSDAGSGPGTAGRGGAGAGGASSTASGGSSAGGTRSPGGGVAGAGGGSSGAAGAPAGLKCDQTFTDEDTKRPGCITDVGGITFKLLPLAAGKTVKGLAVYFHEDTAAEWQTDALFSGVAAWMESRDIIVAAPLSPVAYDDDPPSTRSFGAAQDSDAQKVGTAIETFAAAYGAPTTHVLYYSMSGGSWFLTRSFIPLLGGSLPGLFALSCGASDSWSDYAWNEKAASPRDQIKILFNYGTADFLLDSEESSFAKYMADGFRVSKNTYPGAEHCVHPVVEPTLAFWGANL